MFDTNKQSVYRGPVSTLNTAIQHFGSRRALADALGLTVMAIHQWENRQVPAERAVEIEILSGGKIKRESLRPDLYGSKPVLKNPDT